jgi:hypothetical protein
LPARALALIVPMALATGVMGSCSEWRRSLGEDCLKDQDCLSGVCLAFHCGTTPPYLNAEGPLVGAEGAGGPPPIEAATDDAPAEASAERDATVEAGRGGDARAEGGTVDAAEAAVGPDAAAPDGSADARADGPAEASVDTGVDAPADSSSDVAAGG